MPLSSALNAVLFAVVGIALYAVALVLVARALPGNLWRKAVDEGNLYAAIVLAAVALALGWIVAGAVH